MVTKQAPLRVRVLDVDLSVTNYDEVCDLIYEWSLKKKSAYICACNVSSVLEARKNPKFAKVLNGAMIATPDGVPLVWALRWLGVRGQQRVYGPDILLRFAKYVAAKTGHTSFFIGGGPGIAYRLGKELRDRYPGFEVAGTYSPPYTNLTLQEDRSIVDRINRSGATVVWVGLGAPKQEIWMADHADKINAVMIGVGAAFDFISGNIPQAPIWIRNLGFEWLFRVVVEPRRLWRKALRLWLFPFYFLLQLCRWR